MPTMNPLFDLTGEKAANGQSGPVFFLCGVMGQFDDPLNVTVERDIIIPPGKTLWVFGMDSTYACAIAILRRILASEIARLG